AVARIKHLRDVTGRKAALANLNDGTNNPAAHFVEKTIAFDNESEQAALFPNFATVKSAHGGFHLVVAIVGEGCVVAFADEMTGGVANRSKIELLWDVPGARAEQRVVRVVIVDQVAILFSFGAETGMEFRRHLSNFHDADVFRELG